MPAVSSVLLRDTDAAKEESDMYKNKGLNTNFLMKLLVLRKCAFY